MSKTHKAGLLTFYSSFFTSVHVPDLGGVSGPLSCLGVYGGPLLRVYTPLTPVSVFFFVFFLQKQRCPTSLWTPPSCWWWRGCWCSSSRSVGAWGLCARTSACCRRSVHLHPPKNIFVLFSSCAAIFFCHRIWTLFLLHLLLDLVSFPLLITPAHWEMFHIMSLKSKLNSPIYTTLKHWQ